MAFVSYAGGVVARTRARPRFGSDPEGIIQGIEQRCAEIASEMQCPYHQQSASVFVDGERLDHLEIEIISCCGSFADRVREALQELINER